MFDSTLNMYAFCSIASTLFPPQHIPPSHPQSTNLLVEKAVDERDEEALEGGEEVRAEGPEAEDEGGGGDGGGDHVGEVGEAE